MLEKSRLMVGQIVTEQKNVSLLSTIMWPVEESTNLDKLLFPWLDFFFLDLRSEGLSNLATLSEPRFARSDNRSALLDNCSALLDNLSFFPTISERKTFSRKKKSVFISVPSQGHTLSSRGNIYSYRVENVPRSKKRRKRIFLSSRENCHNFAPSGPISKIQTVLKMALKFIGSFSLVQERNMKF